MLWLGVRFGKNVVGITIDWPYCQPEGSRNQLFHHCHRAVQTICCY